MVFKFAYLVEFTKGYQPAKFQCCRLSGSSFTEGLQKHNYDVIMTSFHNFGIRNFKTPKKRLWRQYDVTSQYLAFKIAHFVKLNRRYQPAKFHWPRLSGSNFTRAGGKHPCPPNYTLSKRPVFIGLSFYLTNQDLFLHLEMLFFLNSTLFW